MRQDQGEPKRDNTDGNTHQYEERPSDLERSPLPPALTLFRAASTVDPKSGSLVIAPMGRIGAFDGHEHNSFDAFSSPGG